VVSSVGKLELQYTVCTNCYLWPLSYVDCFVIILKCCTLTTDGGVDVVYILLTSVFGGFVDRY